jgi:hypothetical protein
MTLGEATMKRAKAIAMILVAAAAAFAAGTAAAGTCYIVLDRSDNVVYRGTLPPIDLSERGQSDRDAMRRRGEHLIAMESDRCPGVEFFTGTAGSASLTVDQIVGGIPLRGTTPGGYVLPSPSAPASAGQGAPISAPRPAPAPSPSVSTKRTGSSY